MITIALDAMGGDRGADLVVPAAAAALKKHSNLHLILVGQHDVLEKKLQRRNMHLHDRLKIYHATEVVGMDEPPGLALRQKKDSSMRVAINLVKEGVADACVSAGNTGALLATAKFVLKTLPGISRPGIIALIPARNKEGYVRMIDVGANIRADEEQLFHFGLMGSVLAKALDNMEAPRVGLLNVGEEDIKGHEEIRAAAALLSQHKDVNYIGFVEGDDIFNDVADIIVCDGFVGNVALKSIEGFAGFVRFKIMQSIKKNILFVMLSIFAAPIFAYIKRSTNPANYNGARFLGLRGSVIKSHGGTTIAGFVKAIDRAVLDVEANIPKLIGDEIAKLLDKKEAAPDLPDTADSSS